MWGRHFLGGRHSSWCQLNTICILSNNNFWAVKMLSLYLLKCRTCLFTFYDENIYDLMVSIFFEYFAYQRLLELGHMCWRYSKNERGHFFCGTASIFTDWHNILCLCVQYKNLLAILGLLGSLPYSPQVRDFIFQYRRMLIPRSLFTSTPQVILMWHFGSCYQECLSMHAVWYFYIVNTMVVP